MAAPYVGNADFRGYLAYLAQNGDNSAQLALNYTGNDGGVDQGTLNEYNQAAPGATNPETGQAFANSQAADQYFQQGAANRVAQYWADYNGQNAPTSGGTGGGTDAAARADEQAYWGDQIGQIDQNLGRLPSQRQVGQQNILNSYNSAFGKLTGDKSVADRDYNTNRTQTQQEQETAKANIDTTTGQTLRGARSLIGGRGSGSSSAFSILAPYAAGLQGNQQRQQVQNSYGKNLQALDTEHGDTENAFQDAFGDLTTQKTRNENELESGLSATEASLLQAKSDADVQRGIAGGQNYTQARAARTPYQSRISELLAGIDRLGANPSFTPKSVAFKAPELAQYTYDRYGAPTLGNNNPEAGGAAQNIGAYATLLGGKQDEKKKLVPTA